MAHTCPDCYAFCHCGGDIDDIDFGEDIECRHYLVCQRDRDEDDFDENYDDA